MKLSIRTSIWQACLERIEDIVHFVFPKYCIVCGGRMHRGGKVFCLHCAAKFPYTHMKAKPSNDVEQLFWGLIPIERAHCFMHHYSHSLFAEIVYSLKYRNLPWVGVEMGKMMARELMVETDFFNDIDVIVPVPLHPKRLKSRGYNQCDCLCEGVEKVTGIPMRTDILSRQRHNPTQTKLSRGARISNSEHLFYCDEADNLSGKHILLVDDVLTTGSTLIACGEALRKIPDLKISILVMARAVD